MQSVNFPSPPHTFVKLQTLLNDADAGIADVAAVISADPGMSARVLKLANSAAYGTWGNVRRIEAIKDACALIGIEGIRDLALTTAVMDVLGQGDNTLDLREFWRHSLWVACLTVALGERGFVGTTSQNFVAGMLHDIGKLVFVLNDPMSPLHMSLDEERTRFGFDHAAAGAEMAREWNFSASLVASLAGHHDGVVDAVHAPSAGLVREAEAISEWTWPDGRRSEVLPEDVTPGPALDHMLQRARDLYRDSSAVIA